MNHFRSQCGEDEWLAANWEMLGLPTHGFFVDFGAGNGERFSNSWWLEKAMGWRGLLCEPNPCQVIVDRPNCIIERCAIGPQSSLTLGLTRDPDLAGALRPFGAQTVDARLDVLGRLSVPCMTLTALLERHHVGRVDVISVDTEGTEIEAWQTLDLARWRPRVAIIEYSTWELNDDLASVVEQLHGDGYKLAHTTMYNGIFVDGR